MTEQSPDATEEGSGNPLARDLRDAKTAVTLSGHALDWVGSPSQNDEAQIRLALDYARKATACLERICSEIDTP